MPVHRQDALELAKPEAALRFLRRMADQVDFDFAGQKLRAGIRTGSVREYWHPRCTYLSELECLDVTGPLTEEDILREWLGAFSNTQGRWLSERTCES
jgi:hypothetical protein